MNGDRAPRQRAASMETRLQTLRKPLLPERAPRITGSFSFILHRFLRDGFLEQLSRDQLALYIFLVLAGNYDGVSFYRYDAICCTLALTVDEYICARNALIEKDLIAFDGTCFQVLSLPDAPPPAHRAPLTTVDDFENHDPATIRTAILDSINRRSDR